MRVADHELDAAQAAGDQPAQKRQPPGAVFGAGDVQAEDLAVAVGVVGGGDQGVHVDHTAVLADLDRQRVDPDERVRPGIEWALAERGDLGVEMGCHLRDLRARQRLDPELLGEALHPPGADAK